LVVDLQAAELSDGRRWTLIRLAAVVCFALACAFLIGSLLMPAGAETNVRHGHPLALVQSNPPSPTDR
jgi:hypothetical protein